MISNGAPPAHSSPVRNTFRQAGRTYESRLNDCGNLKCQRCGGDGPRHASHGPYWYLCVNINAKWVRIYLGRELDTTRFVAPDGQIDWDAIKIFRARKMTTLVPNPNKITYEPLPDAAAAVSDTFPSPNPLLLR